MLLRMFILDVLQHDVAETLSSIVVMLNNTRCIGWREFWPRDFANLEVATALRYLVQHELVRVFCEGTRTGMLTVLDWPTLIDDDACDGLWFGRTELGHRAWNEWQPPSSAGN